MFKEITSKYTFVQEDGECIKVYAGAENTSDLQPIFTSNVKAETQKQFEVEVAYILVYDIPNLDPESD